MCVRMCLDQTAYPWHKSIVLRSLRRTSTHTKTSRPHGSSNGPQKGTPQDAHARKHASEHCSKEGHGRPSSCRGTKKARPPPQLSPLGGAGGCRFAAARASEASTAYTPT
eukprot:11323548-Alexandrium_andersonii.AAC.1